MAVQIKPKKEKIDGVIYYAIDAINGCEGCDFAKDKFCPRKNRCFGHLRADKRSVIFVKPK